MAGGIADSKRRGAALYAPAGEPVLYLGCDFGNSAVQLSGSTPGHCGMMASSFNPDHQSGHPSVHIDITPKHTSRNAALDDPAQASAELVARTTAFVVRVFSVAIIAPLLYSLPVSKTSGAESPPLQLCGF